MSERYQAVEGSKSGHCCFDASVIDTSLSDDDHQDPVCECFDMDNAKIIADALNRTDAAYREQQGRGQP